MENGGVEIGMDAKPLIDGPGKYRARNGLTYDLERLGNGLWSCRAILTSYWLSDGQVCVDGSIDPENPRKIIEKALTIKPGKYTTRGGRKAETVKRFGDRWVGGEEQRDGWHARSWREDGQWGEQSGDSSDLVAEGWPIEKPEFDRALLPAWANKAIAMTSMGNWYCFGAKPEIEKSGNGWIWVQRISENPVMIPEKSAPKWTGDWKDSLVVWEDEPCN